MTDSYEEDVEAFTAGATRLAIPFTFELSTYGDLRKVPCTNTQYGSVLAVLRTRPS